MANDATEDPHAEQPPQQTLSEIGLVGALARLLDERTAEVIQPRVDAPKARLIEECTADGRSNLIVRVGDDVIGRYTVNLAQPKIVVDPDNEAALNQYADEHSGTEVVIRRNPTWERALLKYAEYDEDTGLIIDTRTGEAVPGLKYEKGGDPTGTLTFTWERKGVGRQRLMRHYLSGALNHLLTETPELMAGPRHTAEDTDR
ncbi:hypothetical protein [Streptomyces sp. NPDC047315]|uniref:hypothetical protein n=1 Tax=Streptomyces sp. NPDC047315 TaxID=3155142 RepID=UPI0033D29477